MPIPDSLTHRVPSFPTSSIYCHLLLDPSTQLCFSCGAPIDTLSALIFILISLVVPLDIEVSCVQGNQNNCITFLSPRG